jgi:purine-binding chemotaxis protein CheW
MNGGNPISTSSSDALKARAQALARPFAPTEQTGDRLDVIEFRLAQEHYAIEQPHVQEVCPFESLTPLPCVPAHIMGIVNLRGQVLPVINLKKFFDLPETGITDLHMIIVVRAADVEVGILADTVIGMRAIPTDALQPSLPTLTGIRAQYLKGIGPGQIVVLDAPKILEDPRLVINEEVQG